MKNHEPCINNDEFFIKNDEFCVKTASQPLCEELIGLPVKVISNDGCK